MWASILGLLDGAFKVLNGLLDYWNAQALKESGVTLERNRSNERTLERVEIAHGVDLEPVPSDKHVVIDGL